MESKKILTVPQLIMTLFLCGTVTGFLFRDEGSLHGSLVQRLAEAPIQILLWFILIVPLWMLARIDSNGDILDLARQSLGKFSIVITFLYSLFFLYVLIVTLSQAENFVTSIVLPDVSPLLLSTVMMFFCLLGSFYGLEGIVRSSVILFAIVIAGMLFLTLSSISIFDWLNIPTFENPDWPMAVKEAVKGTSDSFELAALAVTFPLVIGSRKKGFAVLNISSAVLRVLLSLLVILILGSFAQIHPYPFFAVAQSARTGVFERMDIFFSSVWIAAYFMKLALYLYLLGHCLDKVLPRKEKDPFPGLRDGRSTVRIVMTVAAAVVIICERVQFAEFLSLPLVKMIFGGIMLFLIPFLVGITNFIRSRRNTA